MTNSTENQDQDGSLEFSTKHNGNRAAPNLEPELVEELEPPLAENSNSEEDSDPASMEELPKSPFVVNEVPIELSSDEEISPNLTDDYWVRV